MRRPPSRTVITDLASAPPDELPEYDVCVIGSGPSGATVARELLGSGARVCVLESGRMRVTAHGDELKRVLSEGIHIKDQSRERCLGGASTTWAGLAAPLDVADLAPRPWLAHSGWPIAREELMPLYAAAAERYGFPPLEVYEGEGFGRIRARGDLQPQWDEIEEKVFLANAEPFDFGRQHLPLFAEDRLDVFLDATVSELSAEGASDRIRSAVVCTRAGRELRLRARAFVIACGGIENARLLLNSRDLCAEGLGNERDQVGRYLMNHPKNHHGILRLERPVEHVPYYFGCIDGDWSGYAGLRLREDVQAKEGLLNSYARFEPLFPWSDNIGVQSLVQMVKRSRLLLRGFRRRSKGKVISLRDYSETGDDSPLSDAHRGAREMLGLGWNVARHLPLVTRYLYYRLWDKRRPTIRNVRLRNFMEMEPDPENRVTLANEVDAYGRPLPRVRHRCTEVDRRSLVALHRVLERELPAAGLGRFETGLTTDLEPWPIDEDASHHIGTTRLGTDPATSVVDTDLRLFEVENVYLAGSSVFPTSGCANPTFTLVALSIRLAEHLRREVLSGTEPAGAQGA
jgi:choline dehydrogenase-like flavoprotein